MSPSRDHAAWDDLVQRYLEDDLSASDEERLPDLLSQEDFCRRVADYALDTAYLYELGREGLLISESLPIAPAQRRLRYLWPVAAAGLLLALLVWFVYLSMVLSGQSACQVLQVAGTVYKQIGQQEDALTPATSIHTGEWLYVAGPGSFLQLAFTDGTQIVLTDRAIVQIVSVEPQKRILLRQGHMSAEVAPQYAGTPLVISTAEADAEVLGTRLSISAEGGQTTLGVLTGRVQMRRRSDGATIEVQQGQQAVASPREVLVAAPISLTPDVWSEDFEVGLPDQWRCGQWISQGLPAGSSGGVLAEARFFGQPRDDNFHCITTYKDWNRGLFRIHKDSILNVTYKIRIAGWFQVMMCMRSDQDEQFHVGNFEFQGEAWWKIPVDQWRTVQIPLRDLVKATSTQRLPEKGTPPRVGDVVYMLFFNSMTQDIGLVIDRIWVTRDPTLLNTRQSIPSYPENQPSHETP